MSKKKASGGKTSGGGKAKTASKNNPSARAQGVQFFFSGRKIKPVQLVTRSRSFLAAQFDDTGDLVKGTGGDILTWSVARLSG